MQRFRVERAFPEAAPLGVYEGFRALGPTLGGRLPNVQRVEVIEDDGRRRHLKWVAVGDIPRAAHRVLKPEDLYWFEEGEWDRDNLEARYRLHRPGIRWFSAEAHVQFLPEGAGTRLVCDTDLRVDVPLVGSLLERLFVKQGRENFERSLDLLAEDAPWRKG